MCLLSFLRFPEMLPHDQGDIRTVLSKWLPEPPTGSRRCRARPPVGPSKGPLSDRSAGPRALLGSPPPFTVAFQEPLTDQEQEG